MCLAKSCFLVWNVLRIVDISDLYKLISVSVFLKIKIGIRVFPMPSMPKASYNLILMMYYNSHFNSDTFVLIYNSEKSIVLKHKLDCSYQTVYWLPL